MALIRAMNTAITGLKAQQFKIDVIGDNLANSTTTAFKTTRVGFESLLSETLQFGTAPAGTLGGIDPVQRGLGVRPATTTRDFSQGQLEATGINSDLAIEGDGFFIMENQVGDPVYGRAGNFTINPKNQLHNPSNGFVVQGYMADFETFEVIPGGAVEAINIPIGDLRIAQKTDNLFYDGNLNGAGEQALDSTVLQSAVFLEDLGGGNFRPADSSTLLSDLHRLDPNGPTDLAFALGDTITLAAEKGGRALPPLSFKIATTPPPGTDDAGTTVGDLIAYMERVSGINSGATDQLVVGDTKVNGTADAVTATSVTDFDQNFRQKGIKVGDILRFNTGVGSGQIVKVTGFNTSTNGQNENDILLMDALDTTVPMPTIADQFSVHAPPGVSIGQIDTATQLEITQGFVGALAVATAGTTTAINGQRVIDSATDFTAAGITVGDTIRFTSGANSGMLASVSAVETTTNANDTLVFSTVNTALSAMAIGDTYDVIELPTGVPAASVPGVGLITVGGEDFISDGVKVGDVIEIIDTTFNSGKFAEVTAVTATTIQYKSNDSTFGPMVGGESFRVFETDTPLGSIQLNGNVGVANGFSKFELTEENGQVLSTFAELSEAQGESRVSNGVVYDSLGGSHLVEMTFMLETKSDAGNTFRYLAEAQDHDGPDRVLGTGTVTFTTDGQFMSQSPGAAINFELPASGAVPSFVVNADMSSLTGFADQNSDVALFDQDGFEEGTLVDFSVGSNGLITGIFSNGLTKSVGQIALARFANNNGMELIGSNLYRAAANSGMAIVGEPGKFGRGSIRSGFLEESNVDFGQQFTDLIVAQRAFQANARTISTSDDLLEELVNIV